MSSLLSPVSYYLLSPVISVKWLLIVIRVSVWCMKHETTWMTAISRLWKKRLLKSCEKNENREHSNKIPRTFSNNSNSVVCTYVLCPKFSTCIYDTDRSKCTLHLPTHWSFERKATFDFDLPPCSKRHFTINDSVLSREDLTINKLSLWLVPSSSSGAWAQHSFLHQHVVGCRLL